MSNSSTSSNSNVNGSVPNVINHIPNNQLEQTNNSPVEQTPIYQQTNIPPDTMMEDANPWVPDQQDSIEPIHASQLGQDVDPKLVAKYLHQQVNCCTSLITLATI